MIGEPQLRQDCHGWKWVMYTNRQQGVRVTMVTGFPAFCLFIKSPRPLLDMSRANLGTGLLAILFANLSFTSA
jgi:hypothetical protein